MFSEINIHVFNFHGWPHPQKYFSNENFPKYGMYIITCEWSTHTHTQCLYCLNHLAQLMECNVHGVHLNPYFVPCRCCFFMKNLFKAGLASDSFASGCIANIGILYF